MKLILFLAGLTASLLFGAHTGNWLIAFILWFVLDALIATARRTHCFDNALGTLSGIEVVQEVLDTLLVDFPVITQIATDVKGLGSMEGYFNQQVSTRVIVPTVAREHDAANGYVATDQTALDVNITINKQAELTYLVTDREQSQTNRQLSREFSRVAAHAIGTKIVADLFAAVTAAVFPLSYPSAPAAFDAGDLRKVKTLLAKAKVPAAGRFCVLNSDFSEGLGLDNLVIANPNNSNSQAIITGNVPMLHGFSISEFATLPDNAEKLGGIAGNREAIIWNTRVPTVAAPPGIIPGIISNVTEPNTGLTIQFRQYYNMGYGSKAGYYESLTLMYGFAQGYSEAGSLSRRLVRIVTP